ncbi:MAG: peptidoglycan editing factor PgeF [Deltaproteobacteria bacterium]|nr:peptidoglycan editing factor PgeF [Deltaproteobacteria bacterium]
MLGYQSPLLSSATEVSHRFFNRIGGTSPGPWEGLNTSFSLKDSPARVRENMARVRFQLGVGRQALFTATQVHGVKVLEITAGDDVEEVEAVEADALFTFAKDVAVGVRTADCAPVLFTAKDGSVVGAVHAGWRSACGGILDAFLAALKERGVDASDVVAAVGPAIGKESFEVGQDVIDAFLAVEDDVKVDVKALVVAGEDGKSLFDLRGFCVAVLQERGVEVEIIGGDTFADVKKYFSYRRENGTTGRMMSAIARTAPPELPDEETLDEEWNKELWKG